MGIRYLIGDATEPVGEGAKVIAHVCNNIGGWGRGFVLALSRKWKEPEASFRAWSKEPECALGKIALVGVGDGLWVANMIAQHGIKTTDVGPPIRYDALEQCLAALARESKTHNASVHMPRIGCGLAGGEWPIVERLIADTLGVAGVEVSVYDLA